MEIWGSILLQNSLAGSILIVLILVFRKLTRRFSKLYVYILWLLLCVVLFVPPMPVNPLPTVRSRLMSSVAAAVGNEGLGRESLPIGEAVPEPLSGAEPEGAVSGLKAGAGNLEAGKQETSEEAAKATKAPGDTAKEPETAEEAAKATKAPGDTAEEPEASEETAKATKAPGDTAEEPEASEDMAKEAETGEDTAKATEASEETAEKGASAGKGNIIKIAAGIWALGAALCAAAGLLQWVKLRRLTAEAVRTGDTIWRTEYAAAPFVMPGFPSRIYIPYGLEGRELEDILAHERMHIRHRDPWLKCIAAAAAALHWFNPLVWVAVRLMAKDMEMFCDECVLRGKSLEEKKRYSRTLLNFACGQKGFSVAVYFGENSTKSRIYHILYSKKPRLIVTVLLVVFVSGCGVSFLTVGDRGTEGEENVSKAGEAGGENDSEASGFSVNDLEPEDLTENPDGTESEGEKDWTKQAVVGTGYSGMTDDPGSKELLLQGETEGFACYSMDEGDRFLVETPDGGMILADAPIAARPVLNEADYDGDQETELAIVTCVLHGTGVKIESLFMADRGADGVWRIYQYLDSDYLKHLTPYFDTVYEENGVRLLFDGARAGREEYANAAVGVTEQVKPEYTDNNYAYYAGSQIDFRIVEDTIWLRAELGGYSDIHFEGRFPGHGLEAPVSYLGDGRWEMASDVSYLDVNINSCIEAGLSLYFTGRTEEFREYYAAENFQADAFDRVCGELTVLSVTYPWDNLDSEEAEAHVTVRLDGDEELKELIVSVRDDTSADEWPDWKINGIWTE